MIESGGLHTHGMEPILALVQRPVDSAGASHPIRRNLPKTAPDLAAPPVTAEESVQTPAKITSLAPEKRARLPILPGRQAKKENGGTRSTDPVAAEERQGWAQEESAYKRILLPERKLRILSDPG